MAERATITVHTSPETRERLARLAKLTHRSKSFLGNEAIEKYLANEEAFILGVEEGLAQSDQGNGFTSQEMKDHLHGAIDQVTKTRLA